MLAVILSISQFTYVWFQSPHIHSSLTLIRGTNCHQPSVLFAIGLTCLFFIEIIINNNKTSEVKFSMICWFKICFRFWIQTRWSSESKISVTLIGRKWLIYMLKCCNLIILYHSGFQTYSVNLFAAFVCIFYLNFFPFLTYRLQIIFLIDLFQFLLFSFLLITN